MCPHMGLIQSRHHSLAESSSVLETWAHRSKGVGFAARYPGHCADILIKFSRQAGTIGSLRGSDEAILLP